MSQRDVLQIKACLLSLASNIQQTEYLLAAKNWLSTFGKLTLSPINTNQDTSSIASELQNDDVSVTYFNQVAFLQFFQPIDYWQWLQLTKDFEQQQDRQRLKKPRLTLDIDILVVQLTKKNPQMLNIVDEKGEKFIVFNQADELWLGIKRRFPLATYDDVGLHNLANKIDFSFIKHI